MLRLLTRRRYDACDIGTFPNQTLQDGSGPAAALHSDASRAKYNFDLSWLPGQKLSCVPPSVSRLRLTFSSCARSACTCPGGDHPGPSTSTGRGAPEIDVLEAEKDKVATTGQVASQSAQFAPFTQDYDYGNSTAAEWQIWNAALTRPNTYKGSAVCVSPPSCARGC